MSQAVVAFAAMDIAVKLDRPKSLTDLAVEQIRAAIVEGRLAFGEQLSEAVLAVKLGISKTPVREALLRLKLEGLVDIQPQRGTFVFRMAPDEVREICAFRELAECEALAAAMRQDREALLARLRRVLDDMAALGADATHERIKRFDTDFHEGILACCGNQYLQAAYGLIAFKMQALRGRLPDQDEKVDGCVNTHHAIVRLVAEGCDVDAVEALRAHIRNTEEAYFAAAGSEPGPTERRTGQ
jgi:DNA-binding GntR family transcriptional regulator